MAASCIELILKYTPLKKASREKAEKAKALRSKRKTPHTRQGKEKEVAANKRSRKRKAEDQIVRRVAFVASTAPPNERILEKLRMRVKRRQAEHEAAIQSRSGSTEQSHMMQMDERMNDGRKMNFVEARAHSIAEGIRAGNGAFREQFKQKLQPRIVEQRELHQNEIAMCMQNQRIRNEKFDETMLQGQTDSGQRVASMGIKGGRLSEGISASSNPTDENALGGRHRAKGKGQGKAFGRQKGGPEQYAICRLLANKPKR